MTVKRKSRTLLQRIKIFKDRGGVCFFCTEKIDGARESWDLHHHPPLALLDEDKDENCYPAHERCHDAETPRHNREIKKGDRIHAKHNGAAPKRPKSRFKKMPGGKIVDRYTGEVIRDYWRPEED